MTQLYEGNVDDFTISYRQEIVFYLRQLINEGERVTVMFDDGRESLLTVLLHVDEDKDLLIFDWGGSETANRRLLNSPRAFFVANPIGVRNQFAAAEFRETTYEGRKAFATRIPERFVRLQRRETFRIKLPFSQRGHCRLEADDADPWDLQIVDIGIGGIGLESQGANLPFEISQVLQHAEIDLGKFGKFAINLEVRHLGVRARGIKQIGHMGCRFLDLRPEQEHVVQRFVTQIQRDERARLG